MRLVLGTSASQFESEVAYQIKFRVSSLKFRVLENELHGRFLTRNPEPGTRNWKPGTRNFFFGDEREMESGLIFNQLICEFESRHPRQAIADL